MESQMEKIGSYVYIINADHITQRIREQCSLMGISMAEFIFQKFISKGVTMAEIGGIISGNRPYLQHKHLEIFRNILGDIFTPTDESNEKTAQAQILINAHELKNSLADSMNSCGLEYGNFTRLLIAEGIQISRLTKIMAGNTNYLYEYELEIILLAAKNYDFLIREIKADWEE